MRLDPKDVLSAAKDISTNAIEKSSDIVESARGIIKGDITGGAVEIVQNSLDIAIYAFDRAKAVVVGKSSDAE